MITLQEDDFFEEALAARRAKLAYRLLMAAAIAVGFGTLGNWGWLVGWYATYVAVNLVDDQMLRWRASRSAERRRRIVLLPCLGTALSNLMFVALALPAPGLYGPWGVLALGFLIGGITLYSIMAARASRRSFISVMIPLGIGFLSLPAIAYVEGGGFAGVAITTVGAVLTVSAAISHWRDSARVRRAEQTARARAEAAEAAKTQFLAMVSHDLRTPLTAIRAGAEQVAHQARDRELSPILDNARLIGDAACMMRRLLDDLLDSFKAEAGRMKIVAVPTEPRRLLDDLIHLWHPTASDKGLTLTQETDPALPDWIEADPTRLNQILNNLMSNALKFTAHGGVALAVRVYGGTVIMSVTDTGAGLSSQEIGSLFQPYTQTALGEAHGGGTGLGLVISRELARAMGGDLVVTSRPGEGACFALSFPLVPAEAPEEVAAADRGFGGLHVLIVDDHVMNRTAIRVILGDTVGACDDVASGAEALALLARTPVDLILMDVHMPDMDGWETTLRLRQGGGPNRETPVIAVTGAAGDADIQACRDAGMNAWVAKPIAPAELFSAIQTVIGSPPRDQATPRAA